jgi:hypothetical protein
MRRGQGEFGGRENKNAEAELRAFNDRSTVL